MIGSILVSTYSDLVGRSGEVRSTADAPIDLSTVVSDAIRIRRESEPEKFKAKWDSVMVAVNGVATAEAKGFDLVLKAGDRVMIAPRPRGLEIGTVALLAGLAIGSSVLSYALSSSLARTKIKGGSSAEESRPGFGRLAREAVEGDPFPVPYGERWWGGKIVSVVPVDSVQGDNRLRVLILYGRGEIDAVGNLTADADAVPSSATTDIEVNNQPASSFPNIRFWFRSGSTSQAIIPGFQDDEFEREIGVGGDPLRNTSGVDRTSSTPSAEAKTYRTLTEVDAVVVRVRFPDGLYSLTNKGTVNPARCQYRARTRIADVGGGTPGSWSAWNVASVERSVRSEFVSGFRIEGLSPKTLYDVQVERITREPADGFTVNTMSWYSMLEVAYAQNTYAGFAVLGVEIVASEQIADVPTISAKVRGNKKLRIWDGVSSPDSPVFNVGYSSNNADIVLDMLTNTTYGGGAVFPDDRIHFPSLLYWRTQCDVDRPLLLTSGTRKQHTFNMVFTERGDLIDQVRLACAAGRCIPTSYGDVMRFVYDGVQASPVQVFTDGSIALESDDPLAAAGIEFSIDYTLGGLTTPNRFTAQFDNAANRSKSQPIDWPKPGTEWFAGPDPEPMRETTFRLEGITNYEEALAMLKYALKAMRYRSRRVSMAVTQAIPSVEPGERFDLASSLIGYGEASGRLRAGSTSSSLRLDAELTLAPSTSYEATVVHSDGTTERKLISSPAGTYAPGSAIALATALAQAPGEAIEYAIARIGVGLKPYLCERIVPLDSDTLRWRIEGREYNAGVYDDALSVAEVPLYSTLLRPDNPPGPMETLRGREGDRNGDKFVELYWTQKASDAATTATFKIYRRLLGFSIWDVCPDPKVGGRGAVIDIPDLDAAYEFVVVGVSYKGSQLAPDDPRHPRVTISVGLATGAPYGPSGSISRDSGSGSYTLQFSGPFGPPSPGDPPGAYDAVGYQVLFGGLAWNNLDPGGIFTHRDSIPWRRTSTTGVSIPGLRLAPGLVHRFRGRSANSIDRLTYGAWVVTVTPTTPPGKAIKETRVCDFSGGTKTNATFLFGPGEPDRLVQTNPASPAVWLSPDYDTGSATLSELMVWFDPLNVHADPTLVGSGLTIPSLQADQYGRWSDGLVQQVFPPYPDNEITVLVEVRTNTAASGGVWSEWSPVAIGGSVAGVFRRYQLRLTIKRKNFPNQFGVQSLKAVIVH